MNKLVKLFITTLFIGIIAPLLLINIFAGEEFDESIFNSANTYNLGVEKKEGYYKFNFDKNNKNDNEVDDKPSMTFFTHGLSGQAADFSRTTKSNSNIFDYNERSILNLLHHKIESNIYLYDFNSPFKYDLYKVNEIDEEYKFTKVDKISEDSKHTFVCFSGYNTDEGNDYIYSQFNIMASNAINDIKNLRGGKLPKINLIGHSRGGLTNMQYALDHPDIVYSIYSLNTPYFGTTIATINFNTTYGDSVVYNGGIDDIHSEEIYLSYYNRWNNNYDELYKDIKCYAIGMYQNLELLLYQVIYTYIFDAVEYNSFVPFIYALLALGSRFINLSIDAIEIFKGFTKYMSNDTGREALKKLFSELYVDKTGVVLEYDGLVDIDSQLAKEKIKNYEYKGFERFSYKLTIANDSNYKYRARGAWAVTHAVAPYLLSVLDYIGERIVLE